LGHSLDRSRTNSSAPGELSDADEYKPFRDPDLVKSALERFGLRDENLDEFWPTRKMSGATMNAFMRILEQDAAKLQDGSLFLDADFFSGINKCLNCRTHESRCDMLEQEGGHCLQCRQDGVICEKPKPNSRIDANKFYKFNRIFIPAFTKEITHWSLVVINPSERSVVHYDSLDFSGPERPAILTYALREVVIWVKQLISAATWDKERWQESAYSVAKQPAAGNDCGICTIMYSRLLLTRRPFPQHGSLTPRLMTKLRSTFEREMLQGKFESEISLSEDS